MTTANIAGRESVLRVDSLDSLPAGAMSLSEAISTVAAWPDEKKSIVAFLTEYYTGFKTKMCENVVGLESIFVDREQGDDAPHYYSYSEGQFDGDANDWITRVLVQLWNILREMPEEERRVLLQPLFDASEVE